jgi:hypothetical protein
MKAEENQTVNVDRIGKMSVDGSGTAKQITSSIREDTMI